MLLCSSLSWRNRQFFSNIFCRRIPREISARTCPREVSRSSSTIGGSDPWTALNPSWQLHLQIHDILQKTKILLLLLLSSLSSFRIFKVYFASTLVVRFPLTHLFACVFPECGRKRELLATKELCTDEMCSSSFHEPLLLHKFKICQLSLVVFRGHQS